MNIETVGAVTGGLIEVISDPYIQEEETGRLQVQDRLPEEHEFQAILQQIDEPLGTVSLVSDSAPCLRSDLLSSIDKVFGDSGANEDIRAIEGFISGASEIPTVHPRAESNLNLQNFPAAQDFSQGQNSVAVTDLPEPFILMQTTADQPARWSDSGEILPVQEGGAAIHPPRAVLPDVPQKMQTKPLQQSAQSLMPRSALLNQDALTVESARESPAMQESQAPVLPVTADVSDAPLKISESAIIRQPSSEIQSNGLSATVPMKNCLMACTDRYARAVAEFPGLGTVQVVMTRNNSEVAVNLQASKQSLPILDRCSSLLHQLVSDSVQPMHLSCNPVNKEELNGSAATESGLNIALTLTTHDHSGSDRGKQHQWLTGESDFPDADIAALTSQTSHEYLSSIALSRHSATALIDLHI